MITVSSKDNPAVKHAAKLMKSARYRRQSGEFAAEGLRLCRDAMLSGAKISSLFFTEEALGKNPIDLEKLIAYCEKAYCVTSRVFALMSDTQSPQGILCIVKTLDKTIEFDTIKDSGKFLALENVQDPNNLGTVLRSAEAFGVSGVILSSDCCDIYNPKVVRGSMGAVFRLGIFICGTIAEFLGSNPALNSFAAVVDSDAESVTDVSFASPCVVVIGNEGNGLRAETVRACGRRITIQMRGKAESLNASTAASILIWEMIK